MKRLEDLTDREIDIPYPDSVNKQGRGRRPDHSNRLVAAALSGIFLVSAGAILAARYIRHEPHKPMTLEEMDRRDREEAEKRLRSDPLPQYPEPLKEEPEKERRLVFQPGTFVGNMERQIYGLPPLPIRPITVDPYYGLRSGENSNSRYDLGRSHADDQTIEDTPGAMTRRMMRGAVDGFRKTDGTLYDQFRGAQAEAAVNAVVPEANEQFRDVMRETAKGNITGAIEKFMQMDKQEER